MGNQQESKIQGKSETQDQDLHGGEIHGEGQAHREEREEPCGQCNCRERDYRVENAWDGVKYKGKHPSDPPRHN